ncbi:hypothetical protein TNCV_4969151 [Trichonephila clavipes]|nr:hypothetical protein TNCV_4969151 [Trichonephila clavipes]
MKEDHITKIVFKAQAIGTRRKGKSNLRWIDGLEKDLLVLKTNNWRTLAGRRLTCVERLLEEAKAHHGPSKALKADWKYTRIYNPQRRLRVLKKAFFELLDLHIGNLSSMLLLLGKDQQRSFRKWTP